MKGFIGVSNKERLKGEEGGLISVECTIVRKTHVGNDGGSAQKFITAWRKTRRAKGAATPFSRERSARFSLTSPSPVSR